MLITTTYFYAPPGNFSKGKVFLDGEEAHHLTRVLRAKVGDEFIVVNGIGDSFKCRLEKSHAKGAVGKVIEQIESVAQPKIKLSLCFGVVRPKQLEIALDWATQLGINEFVPLVTDFTIREIKSGTRLERLQKIAIRAIKQSKRSWLPTISDVVELREFLNRRGKNFDGLIYADPDGLPSPPKRMIQPDGSVALFVGPEGGFSHAEKNELAEHNAVPLSLGPARLRAETAAVIGVAKIFAWTGDL